MTKIENVFKTTMSMNFYNSEKKKKKLDRNIEISKRKIEKFAANLQRRTELINPQSNLLDDVIPY